MKATVLNEEARGRNLGVPFGQGAVGSYEQRLIQWGCSKCNFFEKRIFRSGLPSKELDAYYVCRFAGELIDLIGEAIACPKNCAQGLHEDSRKGGRGRPHCRHAA
jgi:hypothetical protein